MTIDELNRQFEINTANRTNEILKTGFINLRGRKHKVIVKL